MKTNPNDSIHYQKSRVSHDRTGVFQYPGLTKREYFAAIMMQGMLINFYNDQKYRETPCLEISNEIATDSLVAVDALIAALNAPWLDEPGGEE